MKVSIIVTSFNNTHTSCHMTMACLANITAYTDPEDYELILVDPVCKPHFDPRDDYKVLKIDKWLKPNPDPGYASCVNLGAKEAQGEYLVFVQNDAFVQEGWLRGLLKYLENGYDLVWPDQTPRSREYILKTYKADWFDDESLHGWNDEGIFAISKKAWEKVGGYKDGMSLLVQKEFLARAGELKKVDINKVRFTHIMAATNLQLLDSDAKAYDEKMTKDAEVFK